MEPADVKVDTCIDYDVEHNRKEPKFKVWGHVRISKNIFAKGCTSNWSEDVFVIKEIKKYCDMEIYYQSSQWGKCWNIPLKEMQKTSQTESRFEKLIKRKDDRLYVKWKGYDNLFNSSTNMKDIVYGRLGGIVKIELDLSIQ